MLVMMGSIITELQNRVTHYDVPNQVTNSKTLFVSLFELVTWCEKTVKFLSY